MEKQITRNKTGYDTYKLAVYKRMKSMPSRFHNECGQFSAMEGGFWRTKINTEKAQTHENQTLFFDSGKNVIPDYFGQVLHQY